MYRVVRLGLVAASAYLAVMAPAFAGICGIPVPEPATLTLFAVGAGAVALVKFRRRK
jgi:hypothetical protein